MSSSFGEQQANPNGKLSHETVGGLLLVLAAALAMIAANTGLAPYYAALLGTPIVISIGDFAIAKPWLLWINDGLMALFFFTVGLEIKREMLEGELSSLRQIALPAVAAVGGMAMPAAVYWLLNREQPPALNGWAIPTATDIAFAMGILSLLGKRVPPALKLFLLTLAIFDDLGAIVIIALFYTANLSMKALAFALAAYAILAVINYKKVQRIAPYLFVGAIVWVSLLKSGVHATLAGVFVAFTIPLRVVGQATPPLKQLESDLHPVVNFGVLPIFAFANAGVALGGVGLSILGQPITLGILLGLFLGKQLGVFAATWLAIKLGVAAMPSGATWKSLYGIAIMCGIGFTMSLFIATLAFENGGPTTVLSTRVGVLAGSLLSAVFGYVWLRLSLPRTSESSERSAING